MSGNNYAICNFQGFFLFVCYLHHQVEKNKFEELSIKEQVTHHKSRDVRLC